MTSANTTVHSIWLDDMINKHLEKTRQVVEDRLRQTNGGPNSINDAQIPSSLR